MLSPLKIHSENVRTPPPRLFPSLDRQQLGSRKPVTPSFRFPSSYSRSDYSRQPSFFAYLTLPFSTSSPAALRPSRTLKVPPRSLFFLNDATLGLADSRSFRALLSFLPLSLVSSPFAFLLNCFRPVVGEFFTPYRRLLHSSVFFELLILFPECDGFPPLTPLFQMNPLFEVPHLS